MTRTKLAMLALALGACSGPTGELTILLQAEDTITRGLEPGSGAEDVVDGWRVRFAKYVVAIGDVRLERSAEGLVAHDPRVMVVDLAALPAGGVELVTFDALAAARWDHVEYATILSDGAVRHANVSEADFTAMNEHGFTHIIEGTLESPGGQSCPPGEACRSASALSFRIAASVPTRFGPCEAEDGLSGVTITEGGTTASISLHGDHVFFDAFPSGAEVIERRAQWLANADLDADGAITPEELMAVDAADLFPSELYDLAGAPIPIETGWDYARSQLATQGHFQGEGECAWTLLEP